MIDVGRSRIFGANRNFDWVIHKLFRNWCVTAEKYCGEIGLLASEEAVLDGIETNLIDYGLAKVKKRLFTISNKMITLVKLEISRTSHPFYTGKSKLVDTAGRIDKFKNKYAKFKK